MASPIPGVDLRGTGSCGSFNLRRTARAVTRLYDLALQDCGIRSTQFAILVGIAKTQPTSMGALAELLVIDRTTLTRSLRLLKKDGLLTISDRSEKRQRFLSLTPRGEHVLKRSIPVWREAQQRFVAALGGEYWTHFRDELEKLARVAISLENSTPAEDLGGSVNPGAIVE
jgi:DNA-binding MarR family transcriptional regulator